MEEVRKLKIERMKYFIGGILLGIVVSISIFWGITNGRKHHKKGFSDEKVYTLKIDAKRLRSMLSTNGFNNLRFGFTYDDRGIMLYLKPYADSEPLSLGFLYSLGDPISVGFEYPNDGASLFDYQGLKYNKFQQIIDLANLDGGGVDYLILTPQSRTYKDDKSNSTWLYYSIKAYKLDNSEILTPDSNSRLWSLDPVPPGHPYPNDNKR